MGFLVSIPIYMPNSTKIFWGCFNRAVNENKKNQDGKRRILSIIADQFTYSQLEKNLKVSVLCNNYKFLTKKIIVLQFYL